MLPSPQNVALGNQFQRLLTRKGLYPGRKACKKQRFGSSSFSSTIAHQSLIPSRRRGYCSSRIVESAQIPSPQTVLTEAEPFLQQLVGELYVKGLVVALLGDGQVAFRSLGSFQSGITPTTEEASKRLTFEIGSISKPLTGLALESLVQSKKIDYSSTISACIPGVKSDAAVAKITMAELATHSSGLPRLPGDLLSRSPEANPYSKYSKIDLIASLNKLDDLNSSGNRYEYSNFGYGVLGLACASVHESKNYDSMMKDLVFDPLEMTQTSTQARLDTIGFNEGLEPVPAWTFDGLQGCGAIRSTPEDMIKLAHALADPASSKLETVIVNSTKVFSSDPTPMGLGWVLGLGEDTSKNKEDIFWHNGATGGYHSFIGVHKPSKRAIVLLSNTSNDVVSTTGAHLLSSLIGKSSRPKLHPYYAEEIPEELLKEFDGLYRFKGGMNFYIKTRGQELWVKLPKYQWTRAFPETPFKFHIRSLRATVEFDGIKWESGLPPHTLTYKQEDFVCHATRDGQEVRKFFAKVAFAFKRLFGGSPKDPL